MEKRNNNKWWKPLLSIPMVLILDIIIFVLASFADTKLFSQGGGLGHGMPAFSLAAIVLMVTVTVIVVVVSSVRTVRNYINRNKR